MKQVLFLISEGMSDRDIARTLCLGEGTIRNYIHSVLSKLKLTDRAEARAYALKHDLKCHLGYSNGIYCAVKLPLAFVTAGARFQSIFLAYIYALCVATSTAGFGSRTRVSSNS